MRLNVCGILFGFASIVAVLVISRKMFLGGSFAHWILNITALTCYMWSSINYMVNEQCSDIEAYTDPDYFKVVTNIGTLSVFAVYMSL